MRLILAYLTLTMALPAWSEDWTKTNTQVRSGQSLQVVCSGSAPLGAIDLARNVALQACRNAAISHLQTNLTQKSLIIETENSVGLHSETAQQANYSGLDCKQDREKIEDRDGTTTVFLRCVFDLSKAKVANIEEPIESQFDDKDFIKNKIEASALPSSQSADLKSKIEKSKNRHLVITSIPVCDSIMIRGRSRIIKCDANPKTLLIYPEDRELIIRLGGYKPKHVILNKDRAPANSNAPESLEVYLEKL